MRFTLALFKTFKLQDKDRLIYTKVREFVKEKIQLDRLQSIRDLNTITNFVIRFAIFYGTKSKLNLEGIRTLSIHSSQFQSSSRTLYKKTKDGNSNIKTLLEEAGIVVGDHKYLPDNRSIHYTSNLPEDLIKEILSLYSRGVIAEVENIKPISEDKARNSINYPRYIYPTEKVKKLLHTGKYGRAVVHQDLLFNIAVDSHLDVSGSKDLSISQLSAHLPSLLNAHAISQAVTKKEDKVLTHQAPVKLTYTGRVYCTEGLGIHQLKRTLKAKNLKMLNSEYNLNVINYDMPSAQLNALISLADEYKVDVSNLKDYVDNNRRSEIAAYCGLPVDCVKTLILTYLFGAKNGLSSSMDRALSAHLKTLSDYGYTLKNAETEPKYALFLQATEGIYEDIRRFKKHTEHILHDRIYTDFEEEGDYLTTNNVVSLSISNFYKFIHNDQGLCIGEKWNSKKAMAFLLQGKEQEFISNILDQIEIDNIISYEFDGLMVKGEISREIIDRARVKSNFPRADLIEK